MENLDFVKEILLAIKFELIRYRVPAAALSIIVLFCVLAVGLKWKPQYVSSATLLVDDSNIIQPLMKGAAEFSPVDHVEEAKKTVYSRQLLEAAARSLGYIDDSSSEQDIGHYISAIGANTVVESEGKRSNYFTISYHSSDPGVSFETAKVLMNMVVRYQSETRQQEGESAFSFIQKQVQSYKKRLESAENAIKEFKSTNPEVDEDAVQKRIGEIDTEIQALRLNIQEDESKIHTTDSQLGVEGDYLKGQSQIYSLRQQKLALEKQLSQLRTQYQESYPDIVSIKQQLSEINAGIARVSKEYNIDPRVFATSDNAEASPEALFDELRKQKAEAEREVTAKKKRLQSLQEMRQDEQKKMEAVAANQAKLAELNRDYTVTKDIYTEMLNRKESAGLSVEITKEGQGLTYRIVDEPSFPLAPTGLTFVHFLMAAPVLAIGAPLGLVIALVLLDPRIRTVSNLISGAGKELRLLCVVPHYHTAFGARIIKKDMLVLSIVLAVVLVVYGYIAYLGLNG